MTQGWDFDTLVGALENRVAALGERVEAHPEEASSLVPQLLTELSVSLEELQVAGEELANQGAQLQTAAQHLEEERRRYADLFDLAPSAYLVTEGSGFIQEANQAALSLLDRTSGQLVGTPLTAVFERQTWSRLSALARQASEEGQAVEVEMELRRRGRQPFVASVRLATSGGKDRPHTVRWIIRDTSARAAAEAQLSQANQFKDALLLAVSHDLRSPVSAIAALAERLADTGNALAPEQVRTIGSSMLASARSIESVVANLLDVDHLGRGTVELSRRPTDVAQLVEHCLEVTGITQAHAEVPPLVAEVDPGLLERILCNLVANGDRFSPAGSEVVIRASQVEGGLLVEVDDAGPGVPDSAKESVFELFHRGARAVGGAGVGLYLVRQFAELHGGRAWVEDAPGGGASFKVLLPGPVGTPQGSRQH